MLETPQAWITQDAPWKDNYTSPELTQMCAAFAATHIKPFFMRQGAARPLTTAKRHPPTTDLDEPKTSGANSALVLKAWYRVERPPAGSHRNAPSNWPRSCTPAPDNACTPLPPNSNARKPAHRAQAKGSAGYHTSRLTRLAERPVPRTARGAPATAGRRPGRLANNGACWNSAGGRLPFGRRNSAVARPSSPEPEPNI